MPKEGRPRERFLKQGPEALSDAELFAIFLRIGTPGENAIDMSNRLIAEYGLDKLFECSLKELQKIKGIGPSKAMQILSMIELMKRHNNSKKPNKHIKSAKDVFDLVYEKLKDEKKEKFITLHLSTNNYVIKEEDISSGILNASIVHPREIFNPAIKNYANKIILVHNHPSGDPTPSEEDLTITNKLIDAGELLGIAVLDHVIIGDNKWWSWKERKFL